MTYEQLVEQHERIQRLLAELKMVAQCATPRSREASAVLALLASALRDHLVDEQPVMNRTLGAAAGDRHADVARCSVAELAKLQESWSTYLYRWGKMQGAARWGDFARETLEMLDRLTARIEFETAVLYSLALHYNVIETEARP